MKDVIHMKDVINAFYQEWKMYKADPKVRENPDPPMGVVFSVEGFWMWLLEKYT